MLRFKKKLEFLRPQTTYIEAVFSVVNSTEIANKHILLVDDVITTGATLAACANARLENGASKVNIAALAFAE